MTDALKKWAYDSADKVYVSERAHALSAVAAEFWIRAFCDEVDRRIGHNSDSVWEDIGVSYEAMKEELLGDDPK